MAGIAELRHFPLIPPQLERGERPLDGEMKVQIIETKQSVPDKPSFDRTRRRLHCTTHRPATQPRPPQAAAEGRCPGEKERVEEKTVRSRYGS